MRLPFLPTRKICLLAGILLLLIEVAQAQTFQVPGIKELDPALLKRRSCEFDPGANAVVLFHVAETVNDKNQMVTTHRKRIQVLNKSGLDEGTIIIPFYSGDDVEVIASVEGETANAGAAGFAVWTDLDKKSVFTEKIDAKRSRVKVVMPNLVEGSIFEIRWTVRAKHYGLLDYWDFQGDLPVEKSAYLLEILPTAEFAYSVQKNPKYPIVIKPTKEDGRIYFEMNNVPALDFEAYMDAPINYLQRVIFQLSSINQGYGSPTKVNQTWEQLSNKLLSGEEYGPELKKKLEVPELDAVMATLTNDEEKIKAIYAFVQKRINWDRYIGTGTGDGVKKTLEKGEGSASEMNLVLLNLLLRYGIVAYPLLVAERDFGKVDINYPFRDKFSRVAAYALLHNGQQAWIMDATQQGLPANVTPYQLLNTIAFLVDKKEPKLIQIVRPGDRFQKKIEVNATVDIAAEKITGTVRVERLGYARYAGSSSFNGAAVNPIAAVDEERIENVTIDKVEKPVPENEAAPLVKILQYHQDMPGDAATLYYNSNLLMGLGKNPFNSTKRFTDVNFGYPIQVIQIEKVTLPAGSTLKEEVPEQMMISDDNKIMLNRKVSLEGNVLTIRTTFQQQTTLVPANEYEPLRKFYADMMSLLEQPVVIALGK